MDQVVAQQHRERLAAHVLLGHRDGVAETGGLALADVVDRGHVRELADLLQLVELALLLQEGFELQGAVEVVLDASACCGP